jgi:uncharacterized membrane protein YsdA (DUF1294 family)/cold shock CspA family protein
MRTEGILKIWNEERGFGFIAPLQGGDDIFLHANAFKGHAGRPRAGLSVSFEIEIGPQGHKRAKNATPLHTTRLQRQSRAHSTTRWSPLALAAIPFWAALYLAISFNWGISRKVALVYLVLSLLAVLAYAFDKAAAVRRGQRVPERLLLLLGLFGGWPGALLAQQLLRHKTSKASFRSAFWFTVVLNIIALVCLNSPVARHLFGR